MSSTDHPALESVDEIRSMLRAGQQVAPELQEIFCEEAEGHLRAIYDGLDRLQVNGADTVALADIRRASHTLKGAAGAVGVQSVTRLAHRMEDLLDDLAEKARSANSQVTMLLLSTADRLQELTSESFDIDTMSSLIADLYTQYHSLLPTAGRTPAASDAGVDVDMDLIDDDDFDGDDHELTAALAAFGADLDDEEDNEALTAAAAALDQKPSSIALSNSNSTAEPTDTAKPSGDVAAPGKGESHIRVPLSRLDEMVRLVGEMIINRSAFAQRLGDFSGQIDDLQVALSRLRGVSNDVETRYSVEALKEPERGWNGGKHRFASTNRWAERSSRSNEPDRENGFDELEFDRYNEFHLLARTLSEATGDVAAIALEYKTLSGDFDALLGRWQRLTRDAQDRLMQIRMVPLRTAIPRLGRAVRSTASQCNKSVQFVVRGDHTEMDKTVLEEIADPLLHLVRNAVDHGIETPEQRVAAGKPAAATLTIEAVNQGTQLTLSVDDDGRGLDVDKIRGRGIERGLIDADEKLSDADIHKLIFAPGFSTAACVTDVSGRGVGMDVVRETVQRLKGTIRLDSTPGQGTRFTIILPTTLAVTRALVVVGAGSSFAVPMQAISKISRLDPSRVRKIGDDAVLDLDGKTYRLNRMTEQLGIAAPKDFDTTAPLMVIQSGDRSVALVVDEIEGGQDIVVKSLGDHLRHVPGVIGATVRGDGSVIPILDPAALVGLSRDSQGAEFKYASSTRRAATCDRRRNVMIVDDSVSVRRITASVMRGGGWSVSTAKDGIDALEQLANTDTDPNVILLDMEMPRMDGLELLSHLRSTEEYLHTPVVMVTSRAGEKHRKRAIQAGATKYVVKPFRDDQLLAIAAKLADQPVATV